MHDDHSDDQHIDPALDDELKAAAEREILLNKRRAKQTGRAANKKAKVMLITIFGGSVLLLLLLSGPRAIISLLTGAQDSSEVSKVNLEVDREKNERSRLDFSVPPPPPEPEPEAPIDPNLVWNKRFAELQSKLDEVERTKDPGLTAKQVETMLSDYNSAITKKFDAERAKLEEQNRQLRDEAERMKSDRSRSEAEAALREAAAKERIKIEKAQRESGSLIVDEQSDFSIGGPSASASVDEREELNQNAQFLRTAASQQAKTSVSAKLYDPSRTVVQGTIISAVLETAIDTQLPGNIRAQVTSSVYSFDGKRILMPPGTILIGQFNDGISIGQSRVLIAWNRAITPEGKSIMLASTGADTLGRAGTLGNVDNRYGKKFGAAAMISAITAVPSILSDRLSGKNKGSEQGGRGGTTVNIGGELANETGSELADQSAGVLEQYLSLPPIIRVPQGEDIRVFVNQDLFFK